MVLDDRLDSRSDWAEVGLFVVSLVIAVSLAAVGPWQVGTPSVDGGCPVRGDAGAIPLEGDRTADDLEAVEVFVTVSPPHTGAADCRRESLAPGESVDVRGVTVAADDGGTVLVDGERLSPSTGWDRSETYRSITDPWYTYARDLRIYSAGPVDRVRTGGETREIDRQVVVVTVSSTERASLSPLTGAIFFSATMLVVGIALEWSVRYADVDVGSSGDPDADGTADAEEWFP